MVKYFSFGKDDGELKNTVATSTPIKSLSIYQRASSARTDEKLYVSTDGSTWILTSEADYANNDYYYFKVACESSSSSYSNFNIRLQLAGQDNATNVANYIMYEDTNNQCTTKLDLAISKLNTMLSDDKNTFWTSDDYVIRTARERLIAWAAHEQKTLTYNEGSFHANAARNMINISSSNNPMVVITIISIITALSLGGYVFLKRRKEY